MNNKALMKSMLIACVNTFILCLGIEQTSSGDDTKRESPNVFFFNPGLKENVSMTSAESFNLPWVHVVNEKQSDPSEISCEDKTVTPITRQSGLLPNTSRAVEFLDFILAFKDYTSVVSCGAENISKHHADHVKKITCVPRNTSDLETVSVQIMNSSELLQQLGSRNLTNGHCTVVLFYAPWCIFSARVAPHYNALARAFPKLDVVAIDAFHFSNLNSRFGTIAVPNVMIFHNAKAVARFNGTERTLESLASFVNNVTGMSANSSVTVTDEDAVGPLKSQPNQESDYLLWLSWAFVILCSAMAVARSDVGFRVWNTLVAIGHHQEHHHHHID